MFVWPCNFRFLLFSGISIYDTQNVVNRKRKIDPARSQQQSNEDARRTPPRVRERADADRREEQERLARERADADRRARERADLDRRAREQESEEQSGWWNDWMNGDDEETQRIDNRQSATVRDRRLREDDRRPREEDLRRDPSHEDERRFDRQREVERQEVISIDLLLEQQRQRKRRDRENRMEELRRREEERLEHEWILAYPGIRFAVRSNAELLAVEQKLRSDGQFKQKLASF